MELRFLHVGLLLALSLCTSSSPTPLPGSPDAGRLPEPPRYLLPDGTRPADYRPVDPGVFDPAFLVSELGVAPTRFEDLPYFTADRLKFVHVQVADFATPDAAREAYRNYTAAFPPDLCTNRSSPGWGDDSLLCDNRGRAAGSYFTVRRGRAMLLAFTHGNRTPFSDTEAFARSTLGLLGGP